MVCYYKVRQLFYYKVRQVLLQSATVITKCDNYITKCDRYYSGYYQVRQYTTPFSPLRVLFTSHYMSGNPLLISIKEI